MIGEMTTLIKIILLPIITSQVEKKKGREIEREINREKKTDLNMKKEEGANPDPDQEIERIRESLKEKDIPIQDPDREKILDYYIRNNVIIKN